jgi:Glycoside-hydrolase family GH114
VEECFHYRECGRARPFILAGKAVLEVEYKLHRSAFCNRAKTLGFSAMRKRLALGPWRRACV